LSVLLFAVFILALAGSALAQSRPAIEAEFVVLEDGTSPFEDWTPNQPATAPPTSFIKNFVQEPGDDLDGTNGYVRTGDKVIYQAAFNVNEVPKSNIVITFQLTGDANATFNKDDLPLDICDKNLSTISPDKRTMTCYAGNVPGPNSVTFAIKPIAYISPGSLNGDIVGATATLTSTEYTPPVATAADTEVSAAPRWDLQKKFGSKSVTKRGGVFGFDTTWDIEIKAGDTDSRGNSDLALPIVYTDTFGWQTNGASTQTYLVSPSECTQASPGGPVSCSFNDTGKKTLRFFTPLSEIDGFDGIPGNNVGTGTLVNSVGLDPNNPTPTSVWDPNDKAGVSNWGTGTEYPGNNTAQQELTLATKRDGVNKYFDPRNSSAPARVVDGTQIKAYVEYSTGSTGTSNLINPVLCDKFDNSRFALRNAYSGDAAEVNLGKNNPKPTVVIEYGYNSGWGTHSSDGDSAEWYRQNTTNCADAGATSGWVTGADVDWANGGAKTINAADVNMIRARIIGTLQPTGDNRIRMTVQWTVLDNDAGEWLVNSSSFYDETTASWLNSTCYGVSGANCPGTPQLGGSQRPGDRADVYLHVDAPVSIRKQVCEPGDADDCTYDSVLAAPGNIIPFKLFPHVGDLDWNNNEPVWPTPGAAALNVVVTDVLPKNLDYVLGSASINNVPQEPTIAPNTPGPGQTTLMWNLGTVADGATPIIRFNARVSAFAANQAILKNVTTITSPSDPSSSNFKRDEAEVSVRSSAQAGVDKLALTPLIDAGDDVLFELSYANLSSDPVEFTDWADIFPFNGDFNGTSFNGTFQFVGATGPVAQPGATGAPNPVQIWLSAVPGNVLDPKDGRVDGFLEPVVAYGGFSNGLGGPDWPCQIAAAGTGACPALADVTAIRIIGLDPNPSGSGAGASFLGAQEGQHALTLTFNTAGNRKGDTYKNVWGGRFEGLPLPVWSPDEATARIFNGVIGDFVWFDKNNNGKFDGSDFNAGPGVVVNLLDENGNLIKSTTTDANGRYLFTELPEGNYIVEIDPSNFNEGQPLEAASVAAGAEAPGPFTGIANEENDHNATNVVNGGYRSNVIKLTAGSQPLDDARPDTPNFDGADEDSNLTIDFAFTPPPRDWGDLPDTGVGTGPGNYQTTAADNGPSHIINQGVKLGPLVPDAEDDGQPNASATGDNLAGTNDEDGVVFLTPMVAGTTAKVQVTTNDTDGTGFLSLYFDFNGDGKFDGPGEVFLADVSQTNGVYVLDVPVPADAAKVFGVRARFTDEAGQGGGSPTGPGSRGEIEDYMLAGLGDFLWQDTNGDGLQTPGEPGLNGYRVNLLKPDGTPMKDANGDPITTITKNSPTTNQPGYYEFVGLPPGQYKVAFDVIGRDFTTKHVGGTNNDTPNNSDVNPGGITDVINLPGGFNPNIDAGVTPLTVNTACVAGSNELTTILGKGMGTDFRGVKQVSINVPNDGNLVDLYAQYAGKHNGPNPTRVRWSTNVEPRVDVRSGPTSEAYRLFAVYLYSREFEPAKFVKVRVWDAKRGRLKTPRALFVYATHRTAEDYANTVQYNEESIENQVYWDTTNNSDWIDTQTMIMPVSPNYVPVDLRVQLALTENDNDERPIVIRVEIPGAPEFFYEEVMVKENIRDMASVLNITLQDIPVNTQELKITLFSPQPFDPIYQTGVHGGDSVAFLGAAASFECRLPGNP
jgi:hypothetical protein